MAALTRQASVVSGIFSNKAIQRHCLRLLSGKERVGKIDDFSARLFGKQSFY